MAKGYWILRITVKDPEAYKGYLAASAKAMQLYGARFLVRSGQFETVEGVSRNRNVVIEFKDYATALACYHSTEYQQAKEIRQDCSEADVIVVEGCFS